VASDLTLAEIQQRVVEYFQAHAARYGLQAGSLSARYILNWGGFVNVSFTVSDGRRAYHLKLADLDETIADLERWYDLRAPLESRYRAPKIVDWVEMDDMPLAGLLFEHFAGRQARFAQEPALHRQVLELAARLHADSELTTTLLALDGPPGDCADYFIATYIDRFDEDLLAVVRDLPEFVSLTTLDWMQGETRHLEALAREGAAFAMPAAAPTHGDLWENNVLVNERGDWVVLDWDDLALGDPALEYSILLSAIWRQNPAQGLAVAQWLPLPARADPALQERLALCLRAYLLDEVIDTLADYVECDFAPEHRDQVRAEKQRKHLAALELYRQLYP